MTCSVQDCAKPRKTKRSGLCDMHATRLRRHGSVHTNLYDPLRPVTWLTSGAGYLYRTVAGTERRRDTFFQHREVMECILGRALLPGENIHHINGVRDDNRPENLELWVSKQPKGQRPEDLVAWAKEILATYDLDGADEAELLSTE